MLLQIDEREHQVLLEVLGNAMLTLREVDTAGYETMRSDHDGGSGGSGVGRTARSSSLYAYAPTFDTLAPS